MAKNLLENVKRFLLEITNYCNFRCHFCPQAISKRPPEHMDTKLAKNLVKQLYELGYDGGLYFHLLGEPLLHPDIFEIMKFASKRIPWTILFTNGSLLTDNNIKSVFDACPHLTISMQLIDEQSFSLRGSAMSWDQYVSRIRNAVHYKLTHNTQTLLRISVGIRKEDTVYPHEDYFPYISPSDLRANMLKLFSNIPSLDSQKVEKILNSIEIPFKGMLELAPGVSVIIKPMGNWLRIYRNERVKKGYCPYVGKELGILSNGNIIFCHLDYDGKTTFANVKDGELRHMLQNSKVQQEIDKFCTGGIALKLANIVVYPTNIQKRCVRTATSSDI